MSAHFEAIDMPNPRFKASAENFEILRTRIKEFKEHDMPTWGAGRLLKELGDRISQNSETYRSALNKFVDGKQQTIDLTVASALWEFFITKYPNKTLNGQEVYIDIATDRMSHILRHYYEVDKKKAADEYARALPGEYIWVQESWKINKYIAVGRLQFKIVPGSDGHVISATRWVSGRLTKGNLNGEPDPEMEVCTGYAFPKGPNIFVFMKTESAQPIVITIESVSPEPKRRSPFRVLQGSIYAGIGMGPHFARRFVAHRVEPGRVFEICTKAVDNDIRGEFGHYENYWIS